MGVLLRWGLGLAIIVIIVVIFIVIVISFIVTVVIVIVIGVIVTSVIASQAMIPLQLFLNIVFGEHRLHQPINRTTLINLPISMQIPLRPIIIPPLLPLRRLPFGQQRRLVPLLVICEGLVRASERVLVGLVRGGGGKVASDGL